MLGPAWLRDARTCLAALPNDSLGTIVTGPCHISDARLCLDAGFHAGNNVRYWKCCADHLKQPVAKSRISCWPKNVPERLA